MDKVVYNSCYGGFGLSDKAIRYLKEHGMKEELLEDEHEIPRHNPLLVQCIEELKDDANGYCAELKIANISGNIYKIDEYDGAESVITPESIDWIEIK